MLYPGGGLHKMTCKLAGGAAEVDQANILTIVVRLICQSCATRTLAMW